MCEDVRKCVRYEIRKTSEHKDETLVMKQGNTPIHNVVTM
ncbi:839_t:CDS:2 [Cetraspora pellucida]|uniref:839_t:CDS:1 n=1 Tax=Cetraspora pellucida TaxID=1433469 RepID=A0A9N8Z017_9GLOM|nr:839_t:CDS:2 [Cetraspora pellucida]